MSSSNPPPLPSTSPSTPSIRNRSDSPSSLSTPTSPLNESPSTSFRQSNSPYMSFPSSSSSSSPSTPLSTKSNSTTIPLPLKNSSSSTWARPNPSTFVNGRGNVQLASTPRNFIPISNLSNSNSSGSISNIGGAEKNYLKASSSGSGKSQNQNQNLNSSNSSSTTAAGSSNNQVNFPSAFGVRQRMTISSPSGSISSGSGSSSVNNSRRGSTISMSSFASNPPTMAPSGTTFNSRKIPSPSSFHSRQDEILNTSTIVTPRETDSPFTGPSIVPTSFENTEHRISEQEGEERAQEEEEEEENSETSEDDDDKFADSKEEQSSRSTSSNHLHSQDLLVSSDNPTPPTGADSDVELPQHQKRTPTPLVFLSNTQPLQLDFSRRPVSPSPPPTALPYISSSTSTSVPYQDTLTPPSPLPLPGASSATPTSTSFPNTSQISSPIAPVVPFILYKPRETRPDSFSNTPTSTGLGTGLGNDLVGSGSGLGLGLGKIENRQSSVLDTRDTDKLKMDFGLIPVRTRENVGLGNLGVFPLAIENEGGGGSVMNRGRPKTPDPYLGGTISGGSSSTMGRSISAGATSSSNEGRFLPSPSSGSTNPTTNYNYYNPGGRPKTPEPNFSASSIPSPSNITSSNISSGTGKARSILDRPRPRTPDPSFNSLLDSPESSSSSFSYLHTRGRPSYSSIDGALPLPPPHTYKRSPSPPSIRKVESTVKTPSPNPSVSSWHSRFPSMDQSSFDSPLPSINQRYTLISPPVSSSTENSNSESFSGFQSNFTFGNRSDDLGSSLIDSPTSIRSTGSITTTSPPKLDLLGLGLGLDRSEAGGGDDSFGSMFDLASILKVGENVEGSLARSNTPPRRLLQQRGIGVGSTEASRALAGAANERSSPPSPSNIDTNTALNRQDQKYSGTITPKLLPRKEAPKVDLKLELELEIDAAMAVNNPILDDDITPTKFRLSRGNALIGFPETTSETATNSTGPTQLATRRPSSPTSLYSNPAAVSGTDSRTGSIASSGGGEVQHVKRRQRSSISSMLSFKSNNRSASALGTYDSNNDNLAPRSHSPFSPLTLTTSTTSTDSNGPFNNFNNPPRPSSALDKSLPAAPQSYSTESTAKTGSLLSRQFSKLRGNRDSPAISGNSGFTFGAGPLPKSSTTSHKNQTPSISSVQSISGSTSSVGKNAGRRFAEKFGMSKNSTTSSKNSSSATSAGISPTATKASIYRIEDPRSYEEEDQPPRPSSRVGKFLKHPLGMKLPQARKSEDLLTRNVDDQELDNDGGAPLSGRRSFDLLTQRKTIPRRPSIDNLLNLATAQLSKLKPSTKMNAAPESQLSPIPTPQSDTFQSSYSRSSAPSISSNSSSLDHESEDASVAIATRIIRPEIIENPRSSSPLPPLVKTSSPLDQYQALPVTNPEVPISPKLVSMKEPEVQTKLVSTWRRRRVKIPDSGMGSDASMSSGWLDIEDALAGYAKAVEEDLPERGNTIANVLIPFLKREGESPAPQPRDMLAKRQRDVLFQWLTTLTSELREMQPAHRGACLEAVATIAESRFMSAQVLQEDSVGQSRYRAAVIEILAFAVDKLNEKAVYANTLVFAGRVFALAFYRVEGVAIKLLRALPPIKKLTLKRLLAEAEIVENNLPSRFALFPSHLQSLYAKNLRSYCDLLLPSNSRIINEDDKILARDDDNVVEMSGNWLIRFTASDSDLPFAFYRAYHRQTAAYLCPIDISDETDIASPFTAPGFLFLAASLLEKLDALVHRNLRSVTSIGPGSGANFNTNDSANLSFGQKPKVLELANRRIVSTLLDIVGGPPISLQSNEEVTLDVETRREAFSPLLQIWLRACIKKTSMYDTRSVFILLDLIEGIIYTLSYPAPPPRESMEESTVPHPSDASLELFDIPFIFSVVKTILRTADNTVALMRTVAFVYAHFEIFTLRTKDRLELCQEILLSNEIFNRLYLHWNHGVRTYFVRLLVWRLSRAGAVDAENNPGTGPDPTIITIFTLLNVRLEAIRQRHDELEPVDTLTDDDLFEPKRSTICSTRGVKDQNFVVGEIANSNIYDSSDTGEEESEDVKETMQVVVPEVKKSIRTSSKVKSWFLGGLGKSKSNKSRGTTSTSQEAGKVEPFIIDSTSSDFSAVDTFAAASSSAPPSPRTSFDRVDQSSALSSSSPARARLPRPLSASFFSFEFEGTSADIDSSINNASSSTSIKSVDTMFPSSPIRSRTLSNPTDPGFGVAISPRVSLRFSKRISILPPPALEILRENSGTIIPPLPKRLMSGVGYDKLLHPYAVRGLRDFEDSCDEWSEWVAKLQADEDSGKKYPKGFDICPLLKCGWSFADD